MFAGSHYNEEEGASKALYIRDKCCVCVTFGILLGNTLCIPPPLRTRQVENQIIMLQSRPKFSNLLSSVFVRKSIGCGFADFVCIFLKNPPNSRRSFSSALKCRFYHSFHTSYTCDAVWYKKKTQSNTNALFSNVTYKYCTNNVPRLWQCYL